MKPLKRKRGRPEVLPDYLFAVFQQVEAERYRRPSLSVSRICELIAKRFDAVINVRTGKKAAVTTKSNSRKLQSAHTAAEQNRYLLCNYLFAEEATLRRKKKFGRIPGHTSEPEMAKLRGVEICTTCRIV